MIAIESLFGGIPGWERIRKSHLIKMLRFSAVARGVSQTAAMAENHQAGSIPHSEQVRVDGLMLRPLETLLIVLLACLTKGRELLWTGMRVVVAHGRCFERVSRAVVRRRSFLPLTSARELANNVPEHRERPRGWRRDVISRFPVLRSLSSEMADFAAACLRNDAEGFRFDFSNC